MSINKYVNQYISKKPKKTKSQKEIEKLSELIPGSWKLNSTASNINPYWQQSNTNTINPYWNNQQQQLDFQYRFDINRLTQAIPTPRIFFPSSDGVFFPCE